MLQKIRWKEAVVIAKHARLFRVSSLLVVLLYNLLTLFFVYF